MEMPLQLTFGVEIEVAARFPLEKYDHTKLDPESDLAKKIWLTGDGVAGAMLRDDMIKVLQQHGFPVNNLNEKGYDKWTLETDGTIDPDDGMVGCSPDWDLYDYRGVELISPAYHFSEWATDQIKQVVQLMTANFDLFVNNSCGLHVHVGNTDKGFPLQTLKNFCMLVTCFESQINSLHPLHRILNVFTLPLNRQFEELAHEARVSRVEELKTVRNVEETFNRVCGDTSHYFAYNFCNLENTKLKTIEFRQHEASLDPEAINMWVVTACNLINLSHTAGHSGFMNLIRDNMSDPLYTILDLLRDLGLDEARIYYGLRGVHTHPQQDGECSWNTVKEFFEVVTC